MSPIWYSLTVNGGAFLSEMATCLLVLWLMIPAAKTIYLNKEVDLN